MRHSDERQRGTLVLAQYLDDSGISYDSKHANVRGPVFLKDHFFAIHYEWSRTLARHHVTGPIHARIW